MSRVEVHHFHIYDAPKQPDSLMTGGTTRLLCFESDCYSGLATGITIDRKTFPPELIGPKLQVVKE